YYRVRAKNAAGSSAPSDVVGPVRAEGRTIVDELINFSLTHSRSSGPVSLASKDARPYKEDAHRVKGRDEVWVAYRVRGPLRYAKVLAFMEGAGERALEFYVSPDGVTYTRAEVSATRFPTAVNPYGYKLPVRYELTSAAPGSRFLKIVFRDEAQISRVELRHE
ncbi:MAG TPA: hypothetical protein VD861_05010, partial [Pyrinomonadaceae bacterium]|nr:hypothetical protein [Pyrinomonadaceae bacterium]